jgi:hypothetical protein
MYKRVITGTMVAVLVLTLVGANSSVYALSGHGASWAPSFGGSTYYGTALGSTPLSYNDGLIINGDTYNISKYVQNIPTKTVYVGAPVDITAKLWEYGGTYQIQGVSLFFNLSGYSPNILDSNTWVQYSKTGGAIVHDPYNILGPVTATVKYDQKFMYVTFHFIPNKPMNTSWMILSAWDSQLSVGTAKIINAIKISYVPFAYS